MPQYRLKARADAELNEGAPSEALLTLIGTTTPFSFGEDGTLTIGEGASAFTVPVGVYLVRASNGLSVSPREIFESLFEEAL